MSSPTTATSATATCLARLQSMPAELYNMIGQQAAMTSPNIMFKIQTLIAYNMPPGAPLACLEVYDQEVFNIHAQFPWIPLQAMYSRVSLTIDLRGTELLVVRNAAEGVNRWVNSTGRLAWSIPRIRFLVDIHSQDKQDRELTSELGAIIDEIHQEFGRWPECTIDVSAKYRPESFASLNVNFDSFEPGFRLNLGRAVVPYRGMLAQDVQTQVESYKVVKNMKRFIEGFNIEV